MGNRSAKFISTLVASIVAGVPLAAESQGAPGAASTTTAPATANAAGDCLASPKGIAPQGQHWHYRLERGTKRQCWYLRAEGKDGAKTEQIAQAAPEAATAETAAPQPHSVQDAHAEYLAPKSAAAPAPPNVPAQAAATAPVQQSASPAASDTAQQPAIAARWPDATMAAAAPAPQAAPAQVAPDARPTVRAAASPAPVTPAAVGDKPASPLQMLLLVIGGALALAGLIASVIYRFAGSRMRQEALDRRSVNWDQREPQHEDDSRAPWIDMARAAASRGPQPRPVDFDALRPQSGQRARTAFDDAVDAARAHAAQIETTEAGTADVETEEVETVDAGTAAVETAEPNEVGIQTFDGEFEIEALAPELAADDQAEDDARDETPEAEDVDVDVITAMLERLAQQGPRLSQPATSRADFAEPAQSLQDRPGVRA
jgi:hypothetical protein